MKYNSGMTNKRLGISEDLEWFYKQYAMANDMDYLQLAVMDTLRTHGARMTWSVLGTMLRTPKGVLLRTVEDLANEELVVMRGDLVCLSDTAEFEIQEILDDLHQQMANIPMDLEDPSTTYLA